MDRLTAEQVRRNELTRSNWGDFAPHRQIVTELILRARGSQRTRLCVFGAGNTNDLDLPRLVSEFSEIHLIDLDGEALAAGVAGQGIADSAAVVCHGGVDLSGIVEQLARLDPRHLPSDESVADAIGAAHCFAGPPIAGTFGVVASTCLLTQLIEIVANSLPAAHPRFAELLLTVRDRHLRLIGESLAPGGIGLLVTDVVSSDTCPELPHVPAADLAPFLAAQIVRRNFFTGANPQAIAAYFERDEKLRPQLARVAIVSPWRWQLGPRTFAVCAIEIERRAAD